MNPRARRRGALVCLPVAVAVAAFAWLASPTQAAQRASGFWAPAGETAVERAQHTATKLADGRVLVVAGARVPPRPSLPRSGLPTQTAEIYDPATDRWKPAAAPATARYVHTATLLPGGKLLVVGGLDFDRQPIAAAELYDPATDSWIPAAPSVARSGHTATALPGGKVLVTGGVGENGAPLASAERYDPATGSWSAVGDSLSTARSAHTATALPGGKVLVAGGLGAGGNPLSSAELYDPATDSWSPAADTLSMPRSGHTASALPGGKVLVAGGLGADGKPLASAELYDPATGGWSTTATALSTARSAHSATTLDTGEVLVAGGLDGEERPLSSTEVYSPQTGAWVSAGRLAIEVEGRGNSPEIPVPGRQSHSATLLSDGRLLIGGGGSLVHSYRSAELYDPPQPLRFGPTAVRSDATGGDVVVLGGSLCRADPAPAYCGKPLVVGGSDGAGNLVSSTALYDPRTDTWASCQSGDGGCPGPLKVARRGATVTSLANGKVLVVGGYNQTGGRLASTELYDPATGRWSSCATADVATPSCPAPYPAYPSRAGVAEHTATLLPDGRVLVAGGYQVLESVVTYYGRNDFHLYDPSTGKWSEPGLLYNRRQKHRAVLLAGGPDQCGSNCGKVLIVGGEGTSAPTSELFDPANDTSVGTGNLTADRRFGHSATQLQSGKVLVAGGSLPIITYCSTCSFRPIASTETFDPKTAQWTASASLGAARYDHTATLLPNGKLLMVGSPYSYSAELYDEPAQKFAFTGQAPDPVSATLMPAGPASACGTSCGKVLLMGASSRGQLYTPNPELKSISPAGGPVGGGTPVTIEGTGLASVTSVRFGELEARSLRPDPNTPDTKLVAISPAHAAGVVDVTATSSGGTSQRAAQTRFSYSGQGADPTTDTPPGATTITPGTPAGATTITPGTPAGATTTTPGTPAGATTITPGTGTPQSGARPSSANKTTTTSMRLALRRCITRARRASTIARRRTARIRCTRAGRPAGVTARAASSSAIILRFRAPGSVGRAGPPARRYVIKQATRPIRGERDFRRAHTLCGRTCAFAPQKRGERLSLRITELRSRRTYYYAVKAVGAGRRTGPRSKTVKARTR